MVWMIDVSGSMAPHGHIESVNHTMSEVFAYLRAGHGGPAAGPVTTTVLTFAESTRWVLPPTPMSDATWQPLQAQPRGLSELGLAIDAVSGYLRRRVEDVPSGRPVVVLLSDGRYTDTTRPFGEALRAFTATEVGAASVRVAVGIGERGDVDRDALGRFASSAGQLLATAEATRIVTWLQQLSTTLIRDQF